jgi:hypothetical protein
MGPEPVEISTQCGKAGRVHDINATSSFRAVGDKTGIFEHPQVLRDCRAANWEVASKLAHGTWAFYKAFENGAPGAVAQRVPWVKSVSYH